MHWLKSWKQSERKDRLIGIILLINLFLGILLFLKLFAYFGFEGKGNGKDLPGREDIAGEKATGSAAKKSFSEYEQILTKRPLFRASMLAAGSGGPSLGMESMARNVALLGIISQGDSLQALINDKKNGEIATCVVGSRIGGMTVLSISPQKVELGYENEKIELYR